MLYTQSSITVISGRLEKKDGKVGRFVLSLLVFFLTVHVFGSCAVVILRGTLSILYAKFIVSTHGHIYFLLIRRIIFMTMR